MSGHLSSLDLAVAWFNQFALQYAILGNVVTGILTVAFMLMTLSSTARVFKRARYAWMAIATIAQITASVLNSIDARRLGLHESIPDGLFTAQVAMLFVVPLYADMAILPRIVELTRTKGLTVLQDRRMLGAMFLPALLKVPRIGLIGAFFSLKDTCVPLTKTSPLASVLMCTPAQQFAQFQWVWTLIDQSVSMFILGVCMHKMGWGWGDKHAVSKSVFGKLNMLFSSIAAINLMPVVVLVALLSLHASGQKTHIEGYLMALQSNVSVLGVLLAALYPLVRADRRLQLARVRMQASQTEARRLSMMEFEAADPFTARTVPAKTLLDAPHLRPSGMPTLKRHSSHSGYLNSTTYSHFSTHHPFSTPDAGTGNATEPAQDTYTIMNVKVVKPHRDLNVPNWTITTRQRSPHSESEDGLDEKIAPEAGVFSSQMGPTSAARGNGDSNSAYTPSVRSTATSHVPGSPMYRS